MLTSGETSQSQGSGSTAQNPQPKVQQQSIDAIQLDPELGQNTSAAIDEDLLDRIRKGFQLPEFESKYIADYERWNATHPTYLTDLFKRAEPFLFHIVEEIEKRGMPMELALLPAVESVIGS